MQAVTREVWTLCGAALGPLHVHPGLWPAVGSPHLPASDSATELRLRTFVTGTWHRDSTRLQSRASLSLVFFFLLLLRWKPVRQNAYNNTFYLIISSFFVFLAKNNQVIMAYYKSSIYILNLSLQIWHVYEEAGYYFVIRSFGKP